MAYFEERLTVVAIIVAAEVLRVGTKEVVDDAGKDEAQQQRTLQGYELGPGVAT